MSVGLVGSFGMEEVGSYRLRRFLIWVLLAGYTELGLVLAALFWDYIVAPVEVYQTSSVWWW